jgi:hypothetical protein
MRNIRSMNSPQLKSVYALLKSKSMVPTWEIVQSCRVTNPGGIVSEINTHIKNINKRIVCHRVYFEDRKYHFYRLENLL